MTATAAEATATEIDLEIPCEARLWYILLDMPAGPPCPRPAKWLASVHSFLNCTWRPKALCDECVATITRHRCFTCKIDRIRNLVPLKGKL